MDAFQVTSLGLAGTCLALSYWSRRRQAPQQQPRRAARGRHRRGDSRENASSRTSPSRSRSRSQDAAYREDDLNLKEYQWFRNRQYLPVCGFLLGTFATVQLLGTKSPNGNGRIAGQVLQIPYAYPLYKECGWSLREIGWLYGCGFVSSATLGTVVGSLADRLGRKRLALTGVFLAFLSCLSMILFSRYYAVLVLGRIAGGVSQSLLATVLESWLVLEHHRRGFPSECLADTFSWSASFLPGLISLLSNILSTALVEATNSFVTPFLVAAVCLLCGGAWIWFCWTENYGDLQRGGIFRVRSWSLVKAAGNLFQDLSLLLLGCVVAMFDGSMQSIGFLWGPSLEDANVLLDRLPYTWIYATFMICLMLGSILFSVFLLPRPSFALESALPYVTGIATLVTVLSIGSGSPVVLFWLLNVFYICGGTYMPTISLLQSQYLPEETRATIMNLYRVPLNILVVVLLSKASEWSNGFLFAVVSLCLALATISARQFAK